LFISHIALLVKPLRDIYMGEIFDLRRGRRLSYDDLTHYRKMLVAIRKTIEIMEQIDNAVPRWPIA
jgi:hypothetical protein